MTKPRAVIFYIGMIILLCLLGTASSLSTFLEVIPIGPRLRVEEIRCTHDQDGDGINDMDDILQGARKELKNRPRYKSTYYAGGYPPANEGVCTDVIWRALQNAGYNLKDMIDKDIAQNVSEYPRVISQGGPDPNIDFRRVDNLNVFFRRYAQVLTTELIPNDPENLKQWQRGDIVVFADPGHIAIVSDKRRRDGVPLIIHNAGPWPREEDVLLHPSIKIVGHYRVPFVATP